MRQTIPTCYFPTRVFLIDDHQDALEKLQRGLDHSYATYEISSKPQDVLDQINTESTYLKEIASLPLESRASQGIEIISQEIYNPARFKTVSTVVVDYDMPEMTGLDFCQKIKSPHIQKILFTGAADEKVAVKAFNDGVIHYYIRKHDPDAFDHLETYISLCQERYFQSLNKSLIEFICAEPLGSAIVDPIFRDFFYQFLQKNKITEYYLMESIGSYLCLNREGQVGALILYTEGRLEFCDMDLMELSLIDAEKKIITSKMMDDFKKRRQVFYFDYFNKASYPDKEQWRDFITPLHQLKGGCETYYWTHIPDFTPAKLKKIASYQDFRAKLPNNVF